MLVVHLSDHKTTVAGPSNRHIAHIPARKEYPNIAIYNTGSDADSGNEKPLEYHAP